MVRPLGPVECLGRRHASVARKTKGSLGQALVREYFEFAGWAVMHSGLEGVADHILDMDLDKGDLQSLPDLLVSKIAGSERNPSTHPLGQAFYVEVKTLKAWTKARNQDASRYAAWGNVLMVWVSPSGLLGAWIPRAGASKDKTSILQESDFKPLAQVGVVSIEHCNDEDCQRRTRRHFDALSKTLAGLSAEA